MSHLTFIFPAIPLSTYRAPLPRLRHPARRSRSAHTTRATLVPANTSHTNDTLTQFSEAVRGEWKGYEGTFCIDTARATPVPNYYIPDQFTEWGLVPHGFESNHSITVRGSTLYRKFFRVLPAVSLFGDFVDLEESLTTVEIAAPHLHVFADGAFAAGPPLVPVRRESKLEKWPRVELCLRDPRPGMRRALYVTASFDFEKREFVHGVHVVREEFDCAYCDGAMLEGSSGYVEGWVLGDPMGAHALAGEWRLTGDDVVRRDAGPTPTPRRQLYLPEGLDVAVVEEAGGVAIRVGWLVDPSVRVVVERAFAPDGALSHSKRVVETRL